MDPNTQTAPEVTEVKNVHELNDREAAMLGAINQTALGVKARIFDLDTQRTEALTELEKLQRQFDGVVSSLGASHDIASPKVTPDFRRIIRGA